MCYEIKPRNHNGYKLSNPKNYWSKVFLTAFFSHQIKRYKSFTSFSSIAPVCIAEHVLPEILSYLVFWPIVVAASQSSQSFAVAYDLKQNSILRISNQSDF